MKRILTLILAVVMIMTILPTTPIYAASPYSYDNVLASNKKFVDNERTDEYALTFFSFSPYEDWASIYPEQYKVMKEVTKGITSDYDKVKAIAGGHRGRFETSEKVTILM